MESAVHNQKILRKTFFLGLATLLLSSCKSNPTQSLVAMDIKVPSGYIPKTIEPVTTEGQNYQPSISTTGTQLLFISSHRKQHENPQVYLKDLNTGKEKRITYHDGENAFARFNSSGDKIYYSSTTDEIKENSQFIQDSLDKIMGKSETSEEAKPPEAFWQHRPFEIYQSNLKGSHIIRLTHNPGYDSELTLHPVEKKAIISSSRKGKINLHLISTKGTYLRALTKNDKVQSEPQYSPDGKQVAWIEYAPDKKTSHVFISDHSFKKMTQITKDPAIHFGLKWDPNGRFLLFSSNRDQPENYEIYLTTLDGQCVSRLTWLSSQETEPSLAPDGQTLYFTSTKGGNKNIFKTELNPYPNCLKGARP